MKLLPHQALFMWYLHARASFRRKLTVEHDNDTLAISRHNRFLEQEVLNLFFHVQVHSTL